MHKTYVQLSDESMEVFVSELKKISAADAEGEAGVYFTAALTLKDTILNLRYSLILERRNPPVSNSVSNPQNP